MVLQYTRRPALATGGDANPQSSGAGSMAVAGGDVEATEERALLTSAGMRLASHSGKTASFETAPKRSGDLDVRIAHNKRRSGNEFATGQPSTTAGP